MTNNVNEMPMITYNRERLGTLCIVTVKVMKVTRNVWLVHRRSKWLLLYGGHTSVSPLMTVRINVELTDEINRCGKSMCATL